jgi:UDP-glucose 4-epimerase
MILITGGMGFIGLHTAKFFLDAGESVVISQHSARREPEFLKDDFGKRVFVESLDITNTYELFEVMQKHKIDGIVNLVAPPVRGSTPTNDVRIYTVGLLNLLEAGRIFGVKRVGLASSTLVYGSLPSGPFQEDDLLPIESKTQVEAFKKATETLGLHYGDRTGLDVITLRMGFIYGPLYYSMFNLPGRLSHLAARDEKYDFNDFEDDEYDWCHVKDCARAVQELMMPDSLPHRIYNIGGGTSVQNKDVLAAAKKLKPDLDLKLQPGLSPAGRASVAMDMSRMKQDIGFEPQFDIERGLADYVAWLKNHPE